MIGERLKEIRKDHGDTQQDLANKLSVSVFTIQSWEQEKSAPSHDLLVALCGLYQVSSDYLLGLKSDDPVFVTKREADLSPENLAVLKRFEAFLLSEQHNTANRK
ncbi:MAG: helix-turn-helix transcriptional regulator [Clostridia bacterium]|nr:helix-turn-helix transcriptional regulator [Clostridia bacterium]